MNEMMDFFLSPYMNSSTVELLLEFIAAMFGIFSVFYARKESVLVYPVGIISTVLYTYILYKYKLYGDFIINIYYTLMSIYGWFLWIVPDKNEGFIQISRTDRKDKIKVLGIFIFTFIFVIIVYNQTGIIENQGSFSDNISYVFSNMFSSDIEKFRLSIPYLDTFTTGIFFSAMWLMANKKVENWSFWIVGNVASIPLYFVKGLGFTGIQYFIFLIIAISALIEWRKKIRLQKYKF